ncbi:MAG: DUF4442 domain-containing protein [Pirellulales bacterium]
MRRGVTGAPSGENYLNHIGTVHAAAQLALAEACSGEFLLRSLRQFPALQQLSEGTIIPVVRRVESKFRKPANGRIIGKLNPQTSIEESLTELPSKGRCLLTIHIDIFDEHVQHTLMASFDWFIAIQNQ